MASKRLADNRRFTNSAPTVHCRSPAFTTPLKVAPLCTIVFTHVQARPPGVA
jgi:hypothetical protein